MNIIELAKQAGFQDADWNYTKGLEKFADLIRAIEREIGFAKAELWLGRINKAVEEEREACAKVCDEARVARLAEQIRARGNT
jgi:hypothetical protein